MNRYEKRDWYELPLYYDIVFDADTQRESDFLEAMASRYVRSGGRRVLEPACGSGRLMAELARRGWDVTGFDLSEPMVRFAERRMQREGLEGVLRVDRMESFEPGGGFDLAHCLVSTFKYLLDEASARAHLQRVAAALRPGGVYVLGVHLSEYEDRSRQRERWVAERDGVHVTCNLQTWPADRATRTEPVRSRLTVRRDGAVERYQSHWRFRTYDVDELEGTLAAAPELEHVATYNFLYDPDEPIEFGGEHLDNILILRRK